MHFPDWQEKVVYSNEGPQPIPLFIQGDLKVVIAGLVPGQKIPPHPEGLAVYHFLAGEGWMQVNEREIPVIAGTTVITKEGDTRGVTADSQLAFLAVRVSTLSSSSE